MIRHNHPAEALDVGDRCKIKAVELPACDETKTFGTRSVDVDVIVIANDLHKKEVTAILEGKEIKRTYDQIILLTNP